MAEDPTSDLVIDVLEVVALHIDNHSPFYILKVIRQACNEVPDKRTFLELIEFLKSRSTW